MRHAARLLPAAVLFALITVLPASPRAQGESPYPVLRGTVGPGYEIHLRDAADNELAGRSVRPGTYTLEIDDRSSAHNFRIQGDDVDVRTSVEGTGRSTWTVTFRSGERYRYKCDPHDDLMRGELWTDPNAPPPPPPPSPPPPPPAGGTLNATVRANFTIDLKHADGTPVTQLQAGTYTVRVDDQANQHNFHLSGPGLDRATSVDGVGQETWTVTFAPGAYTYVCDPHSEGMRGTFSVGGAALPPPPAPPPPPPAAPGVLVATVRSNYTIDLKRANGAKVASIKPGRYTIEVRDQSKEHNFHLTGPGLNKATTVAFVGTVKWAVTLKAGAHRFVCDPHAPVMKGAFKVSAAAKAVPALEVASLRVSRAGRTVIVRIRVNKPVRAKVRVLRASRRVATASTLLKAGPNVRRLRVPARAKGRSRLEIQITDGGRLRTFSRLLRL
jgi:plastocyanin